MTRRSPLVALALLSTAGGGCRDVDVPPPPDVSPLVAAYVDPTAALTAGDVGLALSRAARDEAASVVALEEVLVVPAVLSEVGRDEAVPAGLVGDGFFELVIRCPGPGLRFGEAPASDEGRIVVTMTLTPRAIGSVVWGRFERCRFRKDLPRLDGNGIALEPTTIEVNADVRLFLGADGLRFGRPPPEVLVEVAGDLSLGELGVEAVALDFRLRRSGAVETRVDVAQGHIFLVVDDGGLLLGARAADGTWACDFGGGVCVNSESGVLFRF